MFYDSLKVPIKLQKKNKFLPLRITISITIQYKYEQNIHYK